MTDGWTLPDGQTDVMKIANLTVNISLLFFQNARVIATAQKLIKAPVTLAPRNVYVILDFIHPVLLV